jgi:hypothetical protein
VKVLTHDGAAFEFDLSGKKFRNLEGYTVVGQLEIFNAWTRYDSLSLPMKGFGIEIFHGTRGRIYINPLIDIWDVSEDDNKFLNSIAQSLSSNRECIG